MVNLLIYINPKKAFNDECASYVKIQIDNSLLFWDPKDIVLATNFPYEYKGIKSTVIPDELFYPYENESNKPNGLIYLLENNIVKGPAWVHDFEAFQNAPFEINLEKDLGLTDYGWKPKWNLGSFFIKPYALDILYELKKRMYIQRAPDEPIFWNLYRENFNSLQERSQKFNITYNLGMRQVEENLKIADKPIKVLHFHPYRHHLLEKFEPFLRPDLARLIHENRPK